MGGGGGLERGGGASLTNMVKRNRVTNKGTLGSGHLNLNRLFESQKNPNKHTKVNSNFCRRIVLIFRFNYDDFEHQINNLMLKIIIVDPRIFK